MRDAAVSVKLRRWAEETKNVALTGGTVPAYGALIMRCLGYATVAAAVLLYGGVVSAQTVAALSPSGHPNLQGLWTNSVSYTHLTLPTNREV